MRCADSLPNDVIERLKEIHRSLSAINAASEPFAQLQRQYFRTMEKYLDRGFGEAPLGQGKAAAILVQELRDLRAAGVVASAFSIMPNHWHAMLEPVASESFDLHGTIARLKGRTSRLINLALARKGALWQREWFDRWMRSDAETQRCTEYILNNPVKAGLVRSWKEHAFTGLQERAEDSGAERVPRST